MILSQFYYKLSNQFLRGPWKRSTTCLFSFFLFYFHFFNSTILSSISSFTTFSSFTMWGATVLVEWFSPGHYLNLIFNSERSILYSFSSGTTINNYLWPYKFFQASSGIQTRVLQWLQSVERVHVTLDHSATTACSKLILFKSILKGHWEQVSKMGQN